MAQLLAVEWDSHEARVAVARKRGGEAVIEQAFCVPLRPRDPGQTFADPDIGQRLAAALAERHISRVETLVAVGRSSIELRLLSLPPAPDEDLPELVRFQAMRQFSALGDDWPLDYVTLDSEADQPRSVLAAAVPPRLVEQVQANCDLAGLKPRRLVMRPCAAASLLLRQPGPDDGRPCLMVELLADEADLTVLAGGVVVFTRTVRTTATADSPQQTAALMQEIRRTVAAAQNQLGGRLVERVALFGDRDTCGWLRSQLQEELSLDVELVDPLAGVKRGSQLRSHPPSHPGRFAPLLGMLLDEISGRPHGIDFLHPRQKSAPPSRRRLYGLATAAAAVLVLAVSSVIWFQFADLDARVNDLSNKSKLLNSKVEAAQKKKAIAVALENWDCANVTWLDELRALSSKLPPAEEAILNRLFLAAHDDTGGGRIMLQGNVAAQDAIVKIETALHDERHSVASKGGQTDTQREGYHWRFDDTVTIKPTHKPLCDHNRRPTRRAVRSRSRPRPR